jgi:very-short-patch-repair endonuclease
MTNHPLNQTQPKPLPFRGGVGGGASQPRAMSEAGNKLHRPTPTPPLKGRGLTPQEDNKRLGEKPNVGRGKDWGLSAERLAELHKRAAEMRRNPTEPEKRLWRYLSNSQLEGYKFRRQSVIGYYIADFVCPSARLIVEVDGDTHDATKDRLRDDKLAEFGFRVLRVTNAEVLHNMDGVRETIAKALRKAESPHPNPSPEGEGLEKSAEPQSPYPLGEGLGVGAVHIEQSSNEGSVG